MKFTEWIRARLERYDDTHNFTCDLCEREVFGGERLCDECKRTLPKNDKNVCPLCGRKVLEAGVCLECKEKPPVADKMRSVCLHEGDAARLVISFKNGKKYLWRAMCELLLPTIRAEFEGIELVTFVPMTKKRQKKRGYNQGELVAKGIAKALGVQVYSGVEKVRETAEQKTLSRKEREKNLERCFHVKERKAVRGKTILIVDDTLTTGATVGELAGALKRAKAGKVYVVTMTSVQYKHPFGLPPQETKK